MTVKIAITLAYARANGARAAAALGLSTVVLGAGIALAWAQS
jgi:hypothetical protein